MARKLPKSETGESKGKARDAQKLAKGHLSPEQAAKGRHKPNMVLGENDSAYHHGSCK